jgi:hypothetical protein
MGNPLVMRPTSTPRSAYVSVDQSLISTTSPLQNPCLARLRICPGGTPEISPAPSAGYTAINTPRPEGTAELSQSILNHRRENRPIQILRLLPAAPASSQFCSHDIPCASNPAQNVRPDLVAADVRRLTSIPGPAGPRKLARHPVPGIRPSIPPVLKGRRNPRN